MSGTAIVGLLAASLGNPNAVEARRVGSLAPAVASTVGPSSKLELTVSPQVALLETEVPKGLLRQIFLKDVVPDTTPATHEEPGSAGWIVAGILGGAITVGVGAGLAAEAPQGNVGLGLGIGVASGVAAGVAGYFLGGLARQGSPTAKIVVVTLVVVDVLVGLGTAVWCSSTPPGNIGSCPSPWPR